MLLLVLILVLVAFGLLVVALLTGNVLSAWLSVAVSVAAAVVLVIDWLQRRSAVKAGRAGAESASAPEPEARPTDLDPVTEVLPVYNPNSSSDGGSDDDEPPVSEKRFDGVAAGQQTVVIPAVQPSGSAARPSGAEGTSTPSGGPSSLSVTKSASRESGEDEGSPPDEHDSRADRAAERTTTNRSDAEATVVVDIRKAGIGGSTADVDAAGGAAGSRSDAGSDTGGGQPSESRSGTDDRPTEAAPSGSQGGSVGSAVAGAAGLAGAAVAGGLAASRETAGDTAKDTPPERTAAERQAVDVGEADQHGGRPAEGADTARPPASGHPVQAAEERPAGAGAPPTADHGAGSPPVESRPDADRGVGSATGAAGAGAGTPGLRPDVEGGAETRPVDGGVGAAGSRPDIDRTASSRPDAERTVASRLDDERSAASQPNGDRSTGSHPDAERTVASRIEDDRSAGSPSYGSAGSRPDAERTVASRLDDERSAASQPNGDRSTGSHPDAERGASSRSEADRIAGSRPDAERTVGSRPDADRGAGASFGGERRSGESWASGAVAGDTRPAGTWATGAAASSGATGAGAEQATEHRSPDARVGEPANGAATSETERRPAETAATTPPAEQPVRDERAARSAFGDSASGHELFEPAADVPQQGSAPAFEPDDTEPPEESVNPALGRIAATVEDEVLVIDEQPRYHVMGCRALAAQQTIPLPAREAVELGFTPCGWCNPVAALGARHPASAR